MVARSILETMDTRARTRATWTVLVSWVVLWTAASMISPGRSWHWFDTGARALLAGGASGGLHVYHSHPELQIGPLSFVVAMPFTLLGSDVARAGAAIAMSAAVFVVLAAMMRLLPQQERHESSSRPAGRSRMGGVGCRRRSSG